MLSAAAEEEREDRVQTEAAAPASTPAAATHIAAGQVHDMKAVQQPAAQPPLQAEHTGPTPMVCLCVLSYWFFIRLAIWHFIGLLIWHFTLSSCFLGKLSLQMCLTLPFSVFLCHARAFASPSGEGTNSAHLVKVSTEVFGSVAQAGSDPTSYQ